MTIARNGQWEVLDYTPLADLVERTDNALEALGLMEPYFGSTTTVEVERVTLGSDKMLATERGGDRNYAGDESSQIEAFRIPFFTLDKVTKASDVQDFREYGTPDTPASVEKRVERNIKRIRGSHDKLRRSAMYAALKGNTYAEGLAGSQYIKNFASVWGVTGDVFTGGIDFTDATSDPSLYIEKNCREHIIAKAQDNASGYKVVVLCGSGFFNAFITHPLVQSSYDQYNSDQEPLRRRLGRDGNEDSVGRIFSHKGLTLIEDINTDDIARDDAYVLPVGIADMFQIHYAPSDTIDDANSVAEEMYIWLETARRAAKIETEASLAVICTRPELICNLTSNTLPADA